MLIRRNLAGTTIALENEVWQRIESLAKASNSSWKAFTLQILECKPSTVSRASWIRVSLL